MKPYFQDDAVTIYLGDCREIVPTLGRFDLMWSDPPYNVGKEYGAHDDEMPIEEYFAWCESWIKLGEEHCDIIALYPPKIHFRWFWNRLPNHHPVICGWSPAGAIRGGWVHQYAPLLLPKPLKRIPDLWWNVQIPGLGYFFRENNFGHPGYTSEDITRRVIDACSIESQTVVDFFGGTGTTGRICKDLGRKCTMIEREERYCEIAAKRCAQEVLPLYAEKPVDRMAQGVIDFGHENKESLLEGIS